MQQRQAGLPTRLYMHGCCLWTARSARLLSKTRFVELWFSDLNCALETLYACADLICTLLMHEGQKCEESGKSQPIIRFFYDSHRGTCQPFTYHGCGGNANNFISINQCQSFCGGFTTTEVSTSPSSRIPSFPSSLLSFLPTIPGSPTSAPTTATTSGYSTNSGILASQFCPVVGEFLPTDPLYHSCNPLVSYSCPHGYTCQNSTRKAGFICCGSPTLHMKGTASSSWKHRICLTVTYFNRSYLPNRFGRIHPSCHASTARLHVR